VYGDVYDAVYGDCTPIEADRIVAGAAKRSFEVTFPRRFTFLLKVLRCLPYALYFPIVRRMTGV
jgi:hypothetical protein